MPYMVKSIRNDGREGPKKEEGLTALGLCGKQYSLILLVQNIGLILSEMQYEWYHMLRMRFPARRKTGDGSCLMMLQDSTLSRFCR